MFILVQRDGSDQVMDLEELTGPQALDIVAKMLVNLVDTHETLLKGPHGRKMSGDRRPSINESEREAIMVAQTLSRSPVEVIEEDEEDSIPNQLENRFWLKTVPKISISDYIMRFNKYCRCSTSTYLAAGRYIYEMSVVHRRMAITRNNVYRVFAAAFIVAAKVVEDILYPYKRFATTSGLSPQDLSKLEVSFMFLCDFDFKIDRGLLLECNNWPGQ